jgi:hypothetical protein
MTAYTWRPCSKCGEVMLPNRNRPCALTPRCNGSHRVPRYLAPLANRLGVLKAALEDHEEPQ